MPQPIPLRVRSVSPPRQLSPPRQEATAYHRLIRYIYIYMHLQGVPNGSWRVSIHHPLGFNWHPFEGPGIYVNISLFTGFFIDIPRWLLFGICTNRTSLDNYLRIRMEITGNLISPSGILSISIWKYGLFISLRLMPPAFARLEIASSMARSTTKSSSSNNSTILSIASSMARSTTKSNSNSSNNQQQQ